MWRIFKLRVCLIGWWYHRVWVGNCLYKQEWIELYEDMPNPKEAYEEGWCRE